LERRRLEAELERSWWREVERMREEQRRKREMGQKEQTYNWREGAEREANPLRQ
jgi:hypothetical protein